MEKQVFSMGDRVRVMAKADYEREVARFRQTYPTYNATGNTPEIDVPIRVKRFGWLGFAEGEDAFLAHGGRVGKIIGGGPDVFTVHFPEGDVREFRWWQIDKAN
jgi:hypothetical protein